MRCKPTIQPKLTFCAPRLSNSVLQKAVHWMTKDFNLVHGNINLSTVYVTKQGDWRLGGLDLVSPIDEVKTGNALIFRNQNLATNLQWSPEMQAAPEKALPALSESANSAIDTWLLGVLIWQIYNNYSVKSNSGTFDRNRLKETKAIPPTLQEDYAKLLTGSPRARLGLDRFLAESAFFQTSFVQTCLFIENLMLKDAHDKEKFFKNAQLPKLISQFPDSMAKYKLLPLLTTGLDFGGADHNALPLILTIAAKLTPEEYKAQMTPSVLKWFSLPDRTLRLCLLSHLDTIIGNLDMNQVSNSIWTPLSQGFTDSVPQLREATVKSLIHFSPKLNQSIVNGDLLKFLAALQVDPIPGIRCNTTICLSKISPMLTPNVRQKVLLQAFGRALKDPFPPSRKAALAGMSFCHEQGYFTVADIAGKLLPATSPMCLDPELSVRQTALQSCAAYLKTLEAESARLPTSAPTPDAVKAGEDASLTSGMFDWALGKMLGTATDPMSAMAAAKASGAVSANPHAAASNASVSSSQAHRPTPTAASTSSPASKPPKVTSSASSGEVPWGDDEADDDLPPVGRPKHLPTAGGSAKKPIASQPHTTSSMSSMSSTSSRSSIASPASAHKPTSLAPKNDWGDSSGWGEDEGNDGWGEDEDKFAPPPKSHTAVPASRQPAAPHSRTPSSSSSHSTNTASSSKGMALGSSKSGSSLAAWNDDDDAGDAWGEDFTSNTTITRVNKTGASSRFG